MYFGMKAHIGPDAESGLVHTVRGTLGDVHDVVQGNALLHGHESVAFGDAGYQGIDKRPDAKADVIRHVAMRPGKRRALRACSRSLLFERKCLDEKELRQRHQQREI